MPVMVVDIGEMRVAVRERGMPVHMKVRFASVPFEIMRMLVMCVMAMRMSV